MKKLQGPQFPKRKPAEIRKAVVNYAEPAQGLYSDVLFAHQGWLPSFGSTTLQERDDERSFLTFNSGWERMFLRAVLL